ncbi:MAG: hypothetical protein AAF721_42105 [Myxococcota bacterium]
MKDDRDPIDEALRAHFAPPSLDALNERIAAAAEGETAEPRAPRRPGWPGGLAVAVAAAALLAWALRLGTPPPDGAPPRTTSPGTMADPSGPRHVAGLQLTTFLADGAALPPVDVDCSAVLAAPPNCDGTEDAPQWTGTPSLQLLGECGGATGIDCAAHDLPAQRALVVHLAEQGADVIVCIEPPWADPKPLLPEGSGYNIFRRTLGAYVLYEITPLPHAVAVDQLSI